MDIDQETGKVLPLVSVQMLFLQSLARLQINGLVGNLKHLAQLFKSGPKASPVHHQHPVLLSKQIENRRLHGRSSGSGEKQRPRPVSRSHKPLHQSLVFLHQGGKFRSAEVRNLLGPQASYLLVHHHRSNCKIDHLDPSCSPGMLRAFFSLR